MNEILPCICGASGRLHNGKVSCTTTHSYCEREFIPLTDWNLATVAAWKKKIPELRAVARESINKANKLEKRIKLFEEQSHE